MKLAVKLKVARMAQW
jgi:hypothetical protein